MIILLSRKQRFNLDTVSLVPSPFNTLPPLRQLLIQTKRRVRLARHTNRLVHLYISPLPRPVPADADGTHLVPVALAVLEGLVDVVPRVHDHPVEEREARHQARAARAGVDRKDRQHLGVPPRELATRTQQVWPALLWA